MASNWSINKTTVLDLDFLIGVTIILVINMLLVVQQIVTNTDF